MVSKCQIPGNILNAWQLMQQFEAHLFPHLIRSLVNQISLVGIYQDGSMKLAGLRQFSAELDDLAQSCTNAKLPMSTKAIGRVKELVNLVLNGASMGQTDALERGIHGVAQIIEDELSIRVFFSMDSDEATAWNAKGLYGEAISEKFPSTDYELEEESKCFAVGRYTAAAFHLMRVLEIGLAALAKSIGADPDNKSWEKILQNIQAQLDENSKNKPADWKETEQYYSEISAQFRNLKNAWRNYIMHVHEKYDRERAEEIFVHVRAIMKTLATRVKE